MRKLAALGALGAGVLTAACGGDASVPADERELAPIPADWISVRASCRFSFWAPPEVTFQDVQGTDSCVSAWTTHGCDNRGSFGGYNSISEFEEYPDYAVTSELISGRNTEVVTATSPEGLVAAVHFDARNDYAPNRTLLVSAQCSDSVGQRAALQSFRTITFSLVR